MISNVIDFSNSVSKQLSRIESNISFLEANKNSGVDLAVVNDLVDQLEEQLSECSISIQRCSGAVQRQLNHVQARLNALIDSSDEYSFASHFSLSNGVALSTGEEKQQSSVSAEIYTAPESVLAPATPSYLEMAGSIIRKIGQTIFAYPVAAASTAIAFSAVWLMS